MTQSLQVQQAKVFLSTKQHLLCRQAFFLVRLFPGAFNYIAFSPYGLKFHVKSAFFDRILKIFLKQWYLRYQTLVDLAAVDYPTLEYRFQLNYVLLSYDNTQKVILSRNIHEKEGINTTTSLFSGAGWQEREVWDFFGIFFFGNQDLRRILTDYGFVGHPLRKDFPLTGFFELGYDERKKQVRYSPVSLAQEFRNFRIVNPWLIMKS